VGDAARLPSLEGVRPCRHGQLKLARRKRCTAEALESFRWTSAWRHDLGRGQGCDSFRAAHGAIPVADGPAPSADVLSWRVGVGRVLVLTADAAIIETAGGSRAYLPAPSGRRTAAALSIAAADPPEAARAASAASLRAMAASSPEHAVALFVSDHSIGREVRRETSASALPARFGLKRYFVAGRG
jgi:hypothetical protein